MRTEYEGAAPTEIESLITRPVEEAAGVVNNVVRITSSSRSDISEVTLEYSWGTNMDFAALDVRERLDVVQLPVGAEKPVLLRYDPSLDPILRIGVFGPQDLSRLRLVAEEEVKRTLERLDGVAAVVVSGGLEEEIQVELDERRMAGLGLSFDQVAARLAQENVNLTGGRLREGQTEYLVRTINEFLRPEDIQDIVIARPGGAFVRLADVGRVFKSHKEREIITRIDGRESVEVAVFKEGGTNTVTVSDAVTASLDALRQRLQKVDPELQLQVITDQARYIRQSVSEVLQTAVYGGILAIVVLFFFLRSVQKTLIISISIPVSVIATFFLMYASGVSLNIMSLGGLTLGIGLLVDNSIVVLEAIQRRREDGLDEVEAARAGASEVGRAVIASTLTTLCVFVPIVFLEGIAGQLFADQALTVTYSLAVSLIVALTVLPMLAARRLGASAAPEDPDASEPAPASRFAIARGLSRLAFVAGTWLVRGIKLVVGAVARVLSFLLNPFLNLFDRGLHAFASAYDRTLVTVLRRPLITLGLTLALLAASLSLAPRLGRELVPELIQGEFFVDVELPPGTRLEVTDRRLTGLERFAEGLPGVRTVYALVGSSNQQGGVTGELRENLGQLTVTLQPPVSRQVEEERMAELRTRLDAENEALERSSLAARGDTGAPPPGIAQYRFGRPSYFSFRTPIEIEIRGDNLTLLKRIADRPRLASLGLTITDVAELVRGDNLTLLKRIADQLAADLRQVQGLTDVRASTEGGYPELQIRFDRPRLASLGLTITDVAELIRTKVQGEVVTDINRDDRTIDIRLRAEEQYRNSARDLANLTVTTGPAGSLPLSAVATVTETEGPAEIRRTDGSRVALISANLVGRDLGSVSADVRALLANLQLPTGFDSRIGGQRQEMQTSFDSLRLAILLAVFMVYLVMASQFESLLHPLVILFSVPFSVIGVLITLYAFHVTVSVVAMIGFILLAGIVVNNAIILVDYTNQLREQGVPKLEALRRAGHVRLRPILMTTATTVLGLLPMALGLGEGSELRTPMALTVIGGLTASTALTLLIIPAVYSLLDRGK